MFKKTETFEEFSAKINKAVKPEGNKFTERLEKTQRELENREYAPKKDYWQEENILDRSNFKK